MSATGEETSRDEGRLVMGLQPVREAVRAHGTRLARVLIQRSESPRLDALLRFASDQGVAVERASRAELDRLSRGGMHQGALAWAPALRLHALSELVAEPSLLALALDGIQDPQNFGAVIRSAVSLGGAALVWGEHSSAPLTPATFRASAGAIEYAKLCKVRSLHGSLTEARAAGVQVIGLDPHAPLPLRGFDLTLPTLLVIGSEHEGMKRAVRRACTGLAHLMPPTSVDSLNASVAGGIALYEAAIQRAKS